MAKYSKASEDKLNTCHPDLITLFNEVVKSFDNTIVYGYRSPQEQYDLFMQGRKAENGVVKITDKARVVTYKDGMSQKSNHNYSPSHAVDAAPYPIDWKDTARMYYFGGFVKGVAARLKADGKITHDIIYGGDWDADTELRDQTFNDLVHFEIK